MALTSGCAAGQEVVHGITIHSRWTGVGTRREAAVSIHRQAGEFLDGDRRIEEAKVNALVAALRAPALSKPDLANLGISASWIEERIADVNGPFHRETAKAGAKQRELLANTLRNPRKIPEIVTLLFSNSHTDDYPRVSVEVRFENGETLRASTDSQYPFLLPWKVGEDGTASYNAEVSRAAAGLLTEQIPNRARLAGTHLADEIVGAAQRSIQREWYELGNSR